MSNSRRTSDGGGFNEGPARVSFWNGEKPNKIASLKIMGRCSKKA